MARAIAKVAVAREGIALRLALAIARDVTKRERVARKRVAQLVSEGGAGGGVEAAAQRVPELLC